VTKGSLAVFGTRCNKVKEMVFLGPVCVIECGPLMYARHFFVFLLSSSFQVDP
jgi:hypothetical protein